jgi:hypothetical protein
VSAEVFLSRLHGAVTWSNGHGTNLNTITTFLAEFGTDAERAIHMAVFTPSDKANGSGLPQFRACANTASTQNAVTVPERIPYFLYPTTNCDVLDSARIRGLSNKQLSNVATKFPDSFRVAPDYHTLLHV